MKKPRWRVNGRLLKNSQFSFKLKSYINRELLWKDKFNSPRVEMEPKYLFSWLWFQIDFVQGNDSDWEWYLWVTKYSDNNIEQAIETFPWGRNTKDGSFVRDNPSLKYNK